MERILTSGSTGPDVGEVQTLLNRRPPTQLPPLLIDSRFGPITSSRVKEFQRNNGLQVDGIVGSNTWAKLRASRAEITSRTGVFWDNGNPASPGQGVASRNALLPITSRPTQFGSIFPSISALTRDQIDSVRSVYGSSLDFTQIFISTQLGAKGLPFTAATTMPVIGSVQIMNCGTLSPRKDLLIHELAHVWQSQHHANRTEFMTNSAKSQAAALAANEVESRLDPSIKKHEDFPSNFPFSAYAFVPGKPFGEYGAEQIANAVEKGISAIVSHIKAVVAGAKDGDNVTSLATIRIGDRRVPNTIP